MSFFDDYAAACRKHGEDEIELKVVKGISINGTARGMRSV
jgi:hypothetical protein